MAYLNDTEKRLLFSALSREKEICKKIDDRKVEDATCKMLVPVVESIERKFYYDRFEKEIRSKAIDEAIETSAKAICVGCGYLDGHKCTYEGGNCGVSKPMLETVVRALEQMKGGEADG